MTEIIHLDQTMIRIASEIYGKLKPQGRLPGEFDLLIAATAIAEDLTLVTNNEKHYKAIQEFFPLTVLNWNNEPI